MVNEYKVEEAIHLIQEVFAATGVLGETFVFTGPVAYFPYGLQEIAYRDTNGVWRDFPIGKYTISAGGVGFQFIASFQVTAGTLIRCSYMTPSPKVTATIAGVTETSVVPTLVAPITLVPLAPTALSGVSVLVKKLIIQADSSNAGSVFVGDVTVAIASGIELTAGESYFVEAEMDENIDLANVYVIAPNADIVRIFTYV
jgi:hypothetical protein